MSRATPEITDRGALAAALVLASVIAVAGLWSHSLWTPDEPTGSAVGRAMFDGGDFVVPRLNGRPFLEKPPLYWWAQAASFRVFGVGDVAARVPSAVFAWLTLVATFGLGRRLAGPRAGLVAVAVLATTAEFNEDMTRVVVDPALTFFITVAYWGFAVRAAPRSKADERLATWALAVAIPLAFLSKGVVAIGLGVVPPVVYLLWRDRADWRRAIRSQWRGAAAGLAAFILIAGPWMWLLARRGGWEALRECLVGNTVGRLFTTSSSGAYGHLQPPWYYLTDGVVVWMPWILVLPAMLRAGVWRARDDSRRLLLASCAIGFVLLSAAASKRAMYLVPLMPPFAVCVGWWAQRRADPSDPRARDAGRWDRATLHALATVAALVPLAVLAAVVVLRRPAWWPATALPLAQVAAQFTPVRFAACALAAGMAVIALVVRFSRRARAAGRPALGAILVSYLVLFLAYQTAGKMWLDPLKNLHDLTAAIARLTPAGTPVRAYRPLESFTAIVNFDLGRTVESIGDARSIVELFAREPQVRLVLEAEVIPDCRRTSRDTSSTRYDETGRKAAPSR